jgi:5-methyltetrahydropteroyltriglutamate--homocysteine methyltransferase
MEVRALRTAVVGSYPFPGWLEFAMGRLESFGPSDRRELIEDAVMVAVQDQVASGLDVITDGEQGRIDFNLSFYAFLEGLGREGEPVRRFGPPAHDQRGRHRVVGEIRAPHGLGVVAEFERFLRLAPKGPSLKASVPGPYTMSGRIEPGGDYPDRWALTEALVPIVRRELEALVAAGCREVCVDEPSMSCYAHREDPARFVEIFNRTCEPIVGRCRLSTHLCFGNFRGRAVAPRSYKPLFPDFLELDADEIHLEMASREFAELEIIADVADRREVAVGVVDVKSYYIEPPEEIARRVRRCLRFVSPERLSLAPDCGLSQTARWAARRKLANLVGGVEIVRRDLGL